MASFTSSGYRAAAVGVAAAGLLIGAFALGGAASGGTAPGSGGTAPASGGTAPASGSVAPAGSAASLTATTQAAGRMTVTGTGTVTGVPNQLSLALSVHVSGGSVTSALARASQTAQTVTTTLRHSGVAASDIQTSGLNIWPEYSSGNRITGYNVSESLTATLRDLGSAGAQVDAAVRAGGNAVSVSYVSLDLTDTSKLMAAARSRAIADARAKASEYARAVGESLGPVVSVSETQAPVPEPLAAGSRGVPGPASVPISPGTQQLSVSVTVVYALG